MISVKYFLFKDQISTLSTKHSNKPLRQIYVLTCVTVVSIKVFDENPFWLFASCFVPTFTNECATFPTTFYTMYMPTLKYLII